MDAVRRRLAVSIVWLALGPRAWAETPPARPADPEPAATAPPAAAAAAAAALSPPAAETAPVRVTAPELVLVPPPPALELPASDDAAPPPSVADLEARLARTEQLVLNRQPVLQLAGYIDLGFFAPTGDGSGYVQAFGQTPYPQFGWVFLGDILAPAVNSRGEVADLGSAPGVDRFDSIHSGGAPGFIANEVNLTLRATISRTALATASINFTPRTGSNFSLGDSMDVDLAQVEWLPTESQRTSLFAGKMESVLGIEYRERKANRRFGITPSLVARYTTGTALGVKVRTKLGTDDWLVVAAAVTNGSNTVEQWHFYNEIDTNAAKTGSARVSVAPPLPFALEAGVSGSYGAQDRSRFNDGVMWFFGPDLLAHAGPLDVKAQWLMGRAPGNALEDVYALHLTGAGYLEADWMITPTVGVLGRAEYRDARVWLGSERLYVTKVWRATGGVRFVLNEHAVLKAEYLHNGEYGGLPQVKDDVFTSSLVLIY
jgi:Putative beta-barrel porin-2, OmpL-like. bbp2